MNKLINQYHQTMDIYVNINLDKNFDETIKSKYRNFITNESLSENLETHTSSKIRNLQIEVYT